MRVALRWPITQKQGSVFSWDVVLMATSVVVLVFLISVPLLMTFFNAFRGPSDFLPFERQARYTLENFTLAYSGTQTTKIYVDTAVFAVLSVALGFVVGVALAWLVERTDIPFRNGIFVLVLVPIMVPPINAAVAWIFMLGQRNGLFNVFIRSVLGLEGTGPFDIFTLYGMVIVQGLGMATIMFLLMSASLRSMDPALEEASGVSGASPWKTFLRVTLPILTPSILSVLILGFIFAIESFEIPLVLGLGARKSVFASAMFWALSPAAGLPRYGEVAALALSFLSFTYILFYIYARVTRNAARYATVTGKGYRARRIALGRWKWPALAFIVVYGLFQVVFPMLILVWASFLTRFEVPSFAALGELSLEPYRRLLEDSQFALALRNSFVVALGSALLVTFVSAMVAWVVVRTNVFGKRLLDFIASSSVAIPGVIAGLSFVIFYLTVNKWVPLYGTVWVLVLAYAYRLAVAYRTNVAGLTQISKELEEASHASGATGITTFRRVLIPLLAPSLSVGFMLIFFLGFRDFTLALLLSGKNNIVLSVLLWRRITGNDLGEAAALSVITVGMLVVMAVLLRSVILKRLRGGL